MVVMSTQSSSERRLTSSTSKVGLEVRLGVWLVCRGDSHVGVGEAGWEWKC